MPVFVGAIAMLDSLRPRLSLKSPLGRALLGEFVGTAVLLLIICCVCAQEKLASPKVVNEMININVGVGLAVAFGVAITAKLSGGHINPAVSIMFLSFRQISFVKFVLYCIAQTLGAFVGAALTYIVYYDALNNFDGGVREVYGSKSTIGVFASVPSEFLGPVNGLADHIIGTAIFCIFICHLTDKRNSYPSWAQPLLIGLNFVMIGTAFGLNAGYPYNPARDLAPRLFALLAGYGCDVFSYNNYSWFWVPLVGPMIGGVLGGWIYQLAVGFHVPDDNENKYELVALKNGKDVEDA
ncbi:hypothetical protein QR680_017035 [Steinernema hermaphroditum]|uniref:Aquaporin-3 n=1 Tax=Steinernema hermaphroditum TaxID=289476 RepID=A0AA39HDJ7_9BILA|nr:hypothetical protein QR680_017035 [Steinernema hermaphroditum]